MDRRYLSKLLALSCCTNVLLCLLIIYNCDTVPSDIHRSHGIMSPSHSIIFRSKSGANISRNKAAQAGFHENHSSNQQLKTGGSWEADELLYDPAFGLHHHVRDLSPRNVEELFQRLVPNMVFYVWCGEGKTFLYKHFLSVYLIWFYLEPDVIEIHYEFLPLEDKYNTWLSWLRSNIPALSLRPLPPHVSGRRCGTRFGLEILADRGGVFLDNGVILHTASRDKMNDILASTRTVCFFQDGALAYAAAVAGDSAIKSYLSLSEARQSSRNMSNFFHFYSKKHVHIHMNCLDQTTLKTLNKNNSQNAHLNLFNASQLQQNDTHIVCLRFHSKIHPSDFIQREDDSGSKDNNIFKALKAEIYGPNSNNTEKEVKKKLTMPNIVHYIWFGRKNMTLSMYLSFLSSAHVAQPELILIHSDLKLYGRYWDLVRHHPAVRVVYREAPYSIYNNRILYTQHRSDIVRADVLDKYGGLYLDWDALWLKSPKDLLLSTNSDNNDIVLSRDHMPRPPFPETINMGVVLAKPRSKFVQAWRAAWVHYRSDNFLYNAVELPYKIYELFPHSSLLHDRLQVMCYYLKCHPLFHPDHKHWGRQQPFDWTQDVYSIHFTHPDPPSFQNETALKSGHGTFSDIGRFIWKLGTN